MGNAGIFEIEIEHTFKESYKLLCDIPDDNYADVRKYSERTAKCLDICWLRATLL